MLFIRPSVTLGDARETNKKFISAFGVRSTFASLRYFCVSCAFLLRFMRSSSACVRRCQPMCVGAHAKFKVRPKNCRRTERTECSNLCVPCQLCAFCIRPAYFLYSLDVRYSSVATRQTCVNQIYIINTVTHMFVCVSVCVFECVSKLLLDYWSD